MGDGIPEPHFDEVVVVFDGGEVVVEDGGDVVLGEEVRGVADEEGGLADAAVAEQHDLERHGSVFHC